MSRRAAPVPRALIRRFLASEHNADAAVDSTERTVEFIASDASTDRYGDVIEQGGWQLGHYRSNPIALWMHDYAAPIGNADVRIEGGRLLARVKFAAKGVSERIDELWRLVEAKVVRALSVGFTVNGPDEWEFIRDAREQATGVRFLKPELLELSLVTVPANPYALALAKSLAADPRAYLHEETIMEPTPEAPAGTLRPLGGPVTLSSAIPDDIAQQVERSGRCAVEVRRSIRDIAIVRNVLGETVPAGAGVLPPTSVRLIDGFMAPAPLLLALLSRVPVTGASITQNIINYAPPATGNKAALVPEATAKPESDLAATSSVLPFAVWAHHVGVTKIALADVPALRQLVDSVLTRGLMLKVDAGVFAALSGAATAFAGGTGSTPIDNAAVAAGQLAALGGSGIVVAMNPADIVAIDTAKANGSGVYIGRPPVAGQLVGVPSVPAGKLLAFASEAAYLAERESVNVIAGVANDDFVKNIVRLLAEWRGATVIQLPSLILYGDAAGAVTVASAKKAA